MSLAGFTRRIRPLEVLGEEQVEEIHRATLEVLETTGAVFLDDDALAVLKAGGCRVDEHGGRGADAGRPSSRRR